MDEAPPTTPREHTHAAGQLPSDPPPPHAPGPRPAALKFVFFTVLLDVLGFGILIPVAPRLVMELLSRNDPALNNEAAASKYYSLLISTYAIMSFFCSPVLGALSDRFGRRPVLLFSIFGSGLDYFAMALSPRLWFLYLTRAVNGFTGASLTVCNAYIADVTPPDKRAGAYGLLGAAFGVGFIVGPALGGYLGDPHSWLPFGLHGDIRLPFYVAGALALCNWLYGFFVLPESLQPQHRSHLSLRRMNPVAVFGGLRDHPLARAMALALFLLNIAMFGLHATWALYTAKRYHWSPEQIGLSLACVGLGAAIVQGGLARKIIPALGPGPVGERRAILLGVFIGVLAYIGYGAATSGWMIYVIVSFASLGGIAQPAGTALITRTVPPDEQGAVQGALTGLNAIAQIIAPLIAGYIFSLANPPEGHATPVSAIPGLSFFYCSAIAFLGLIAAWHATRHVQRDAASLSAGGPSLREGR